MARSFRIHVNPERVYMNSSETIDWLQMIGFDDYSTNRIQKGISEMFYLANPNERSYETVEEVPNIFRQAWPYFLAFIAIENLILWMDRKPVYRLNDGITSLSHGIIQECGRMIFRGVENYTYIYIYDKFCIYHLPWHSPITWYLAALGVDLCYYWVHRASHEIHILWAQHQVHHSSEEFNLAVGLRQSLLQGWCGFLFYLPLALIIPPAHFLTHQQFNLIYQFWIHTKTVQSLGPLEFIFNTPKHHRVHHGSNRAYLDTNYGGVLIIWDRIFGTFAEEHEKEETIYGLVYNQPSFNPFFLQIFYNKNVYNKFCEMKGLKNKLSAIIKGPSWMPGRPWTGLESEKPNVTVREKYDVCLPLWCNIYLVLHFAIVVYGFQELIIKYMGMSPLAVLGFVAYIILSLTTIGMLFENRPNSCLFELGRCLLFIAFVQRFIPPSPQLIILQNLFCLSACFWLAKACHIFQITTKPTFK